MYKKKHRVPSRYDFDLIVLGTGAGGGVVAHLASMAGKKVAVIEDMKIGGECPNFGCVPTKSLLQAADVYTTAKNGERFGIKTTGLTFDYNRIKAWKEKVVRNTGVSEGEAVYEADGISVLKGHGHFLDPWTISVNGLRFRARRFMIATGTKTAVPPIPGLKEAGFITYREAINFSKPPKSLFVIGGGAIGCEFAHLFAAFGVQVHIAEFTPRLICGEDEEVGELVATVFEQNGITVHTGTKVTRVVKKGGQKSVYFEKGGRTHSVNVEEVMVAAGMAPNIDLGLENAGVTYTKRGITVNRYMQTSSKHIYAAGDIVGPYGFTHTAAYQSRIAAHNMFNASYKYAASYHAVPRCVFLTPEVACVGATEQQLKDRGVHYQIGDAPINILGRSNTSGEDMGFVKVLASKNGTLLGASIVSPRAGEVVHELTLAIQHRMKARAIIETIHAFPTWSEAVRFACLKIRSK